MQSLFENAADPSKITVALVEQNDANDKFCVEEYCAKYGHQTIRRRNIREGVVEIVTLPLERAECPYFEQIRVAAFHHLSAKGPNFARSMTRKLLGNEDYCMQIDAHTSFVKDWDVKLKQDWMATNNEFAVLSTIPAPKTQMHDFLEGDNVGMVPRQCKLTYRENGIPDFAMTSDAMVQNIPKPLLSHAWSAAFSFAKCHLEESVPYDPFIQYAMPIEQFSKYARMWTRGYDVYTPTQNIVFHDYETQTNGHGNNEWFKHQRNRFRQLSIDRVMNVIQLTDSADMSINTQSNLGIYGLGKRRTMEQLLSFCRIRYPPTKKGNLGDVDACLGHEWTPYDLSIPPTANMYDKPDDLDPQPEYPLRTNLIYYQQVEQRPILPNIDLGNNTSSGSYSHNFHVSNTVPRMEDLEQQGFAPSFSLLVLLWMFGLVVWCVIFFGNPPPSNNTAKDGYQKLSRTMAAAVSTASTTTPMKKKKGAAYKDV